MKTEISEPEEYFLIGQNESRLVVYLRYPLFKALDDFATRESHREQVGLLVGRHGKRADGTPFLLIEDAIESPLGDENTGRFEEGLWKRARRIAAARHPNRGVVGWFHAHSSGEINVTTEEAGVHKRFFSDENQVLYRIDPKAKDRMFYLRDGASLKAANGFCIYGKPAGDSALPGGEPVAPPVPGAKATVTSVAASPEQAQRYLERTLEKILRRLQKPPINPKDVLIVGLLVLNALLIWFRPSPLAKVDTSALERGQTEISSQVTEVRDRIAKLEQHLADLQLLDQQLKLAAEAESIPDTDPELDPGLDPDASPTASSTVTPDAIGARETPDPVDGGPAGGAAKVTLYKVAEGDTLSLITAKFYPEAGPDITASFAHFNRLKAPEFAIFPGDVLKVPDEKALH
jgi:nucleoid-associated protein YgaU